MIVTVMMVSMLRVTCRRERPSITLVSLKRCVFMAGEDLVHRSELTRQADRFPHPRGLRHDVESVDTRRAAVRFEQGGENPHDRGLAGAVGTEQREDASARHVEVHTLEHVQVLIGFPQPVDLYRRVVRFHA
jgi:hypothetical protein